MERRKPKLDPSVAVVPTLLDRDTGATVQGWSGMSLFWWSDGNGSCDCNRAIMFSGVEPEDDVSVCLGAHRYVAIDVANVPPTLRDEALAQINRRYADG